MIVIIAIEPTTITMIIIIPVITPNKFVGGRRHVEHRRHGVDLALTHEGLAGAHKCTL